MSNSIRPLLIRKDLLASDATRARTDTALLSLPEGVRGLLIPFWSDETQVLSCLAPRMIRENSYGLARSEAWDVAIGTAEQNLAMAAAAFALQGCNKFLATIEALSEDIPFANGRIHFNVMFFPSCVIIALDDIGGYVTEHANQIPEQSESRLCRAPICTIVLPEGVSAHVAIDEPMRVARDLQAFRQVQELGIEALMDECSFTLEDPAKEDFRAA